MDDRPTAITPDQDLATARRPGIDVPDRRGRTGLDRAGRDLSGNPDVVVRDVEVTSEGWHVLRRTTFDYRRRDARWTTEQRETYDRGNGATILLYDPSRGTVLLTPTVPLSRLRQRSSRRHDDRDGRGPARRRRSGERDPS